MYTMANYDKPYMFNIVLNSNYPSTLSGLNVNNLIYDFNWTNIPQGKYKMSFCYKGLNNGDYVGNDSPQLFLTIGAVPSVYEASEQNGSVVSRYIGSLRAETHAAGQVYFYANLNDNPDVYFDSIPTNGPIQVQVFTEDFSTPFITVGASVLADYVLVLSFEQVGKLNGYNI
jgi:hypothetical protein